MDWSYWKVWRGGIEQKWSEAAGVCATIELVVLNTIYQHKDIYKYTWKSKGKGLRFIVDYIL